MSSMNPHEDLIAQIKSRKAIIGIIGMGYVGLPLMLRFADDGFKVLGVDIDQAKVDALNQGRSYIKHIPSQSIRQAVDRGFQATTDFAELAQADAIILCVPTPLNKHREPDMSFVVNTTEGIVPHLRKGQIISLESTTYPGTTEEELLPRLERTGLKAGKDFFLVFSPEREDPGNPKFSTRSIPKVCGGITPQCLEAGIALYSQVIDLVVPVSSTRVAEMTKLLENIHRAVNIGLVNEMKIVADKMGIDIHEVIRASATKPFGFTPFYPGPGLGGHCIPIDPFYLTWKAREYGINTKFIEIAGEVNSAMPRWVVEKINEALNDRRKSVKGSRILILGIAYKKNVDDVRESPAVEIMELLSDRGATLDYSDPYIPVFPSMRKHKFEMKSVSLTPEVLRQYDCAVLVTNHSDFDYKLLQQHCALIVDTRGVYLQLADNVVKA
jgi:UDP-N-acetyl-D-glucosamine dehydrogenase